MPRSTELFGSSRFRTSSSANLRNMMAPDRRGGPSPAAGLSVPGGLGGPPGRWAREVGGGAAGPRQAQPGGAAASAHSREPTPSCRV